MAIKFDLKDPDLSLIGSNASQQALGVFLFCQQLSEDIEKNPSEAASIWQRATGELLAIGRTIEMGSDTMNEKELMEGSKNYSGVLAKALEGDSFTWILLAGDRVAAVGQAPTEMEAREGLKKALEFRGALGARLKKKLIDDAPKHVWRTPEDGGYEPQ